MAENYEYYEYKIKPGDTLSGIIFSMFGQAPSDSRYQKSKQHLLALNPQVTNPDYIRAGEVLRLAVLPPIYSPAVDNNKQPDNKGISEPGTITSRVPEENRNDFWALSWIEHKSNYLTIPGGIVLGGKGNLLSPGNLALISEINDYYAEYKVDNITRGQYDYKRKLSLDRLKTNLGPFEKWMFGGKTTHESVRIARAGAVPATINIAKHAERLSRVAALGKAGGFVLVGVGLTASCMQIAQAQDKHEKNEIFVETIASTGIGLGLGVAVGIFLVSNPIGWGAALVLATGSAAISYASGKGARVAYDRFGNQVDFVSGTGVNSICR